MIHALPTSLQAFTVPSPVRISFTTPIQLRKRIALISLVGKLRIGANRRTCLLPSELLCG